MELKRRLIRQPIAFARVAEMMRGAQVLLGVRAASVERDNVVECERSGLRAARFKNGLVADVTDHPMGLDNALEVDALNPRLFHARLALMPVSTISKRPSLRVLCYPLFPIRLVDCQQTSPVLLVVSSILCAVCVGILGLPTSSPFIGYFSAHLGSIASLVLAFSLFALLGRQNLATLCGGFPVVPLSARDVLAQLAPPRKTVFAGLALGKSPFEELRLATFRTPFFLGHTLRIVPVGCDG